MGLFRQLRRLYRPEKFQFEDFHTEIVAQVLENSPLLTLEWLRSIKATTSSKADHIKVRTQETFPPLAHHPTASRPDITIRLVSDAKTELIFVESKHDSIQGYGQLQRYAEHLNAAQQKDALDNIALVSEAVRRLPGGLFAARRGLTYFRDDHRYVASNDDWSEIECHAGYWLPHEKPDEGVWVGVTLYSNPSAPSRHEVIAAFHAWLKKEGQGWESEDLDDPRAKSSIYKGKVLQGLMGGPDDVRAIKDYLLRSLEEVEMFRQNNQNLGWCRSESEIKTAAVSDDGKSQEP